MIAGRLSSYFGIQHRGWLAGSFVIQAAATLIASGLLHFTNAEIELPGSPFSALPGNIAFGLLAGSMAWQGAQPVPPLDLTRSACNAKPLGTAYQSTVVLTMVRLTPRARANIAALAGALQRSAPLPGAQ